MKKKLVARMLSIILSAIIVIMLLPGKTTTAEITSDGMFTYTVSGGNATITGLVEQNYSGPLTLPSTISDGTNTYNVTSIGDYAFADCTGLTGPLNIPDSVTSIGDSAFYNCYGLTGTLTIPDSVTSIGEEAFYDCVGLTGLTIGNSVTSIGTAAFNECYGLTGNLTIPDSVTTIGNFAFSECRGLTGTLTIADSVTSIGEEAFYQCVGLTRLTIGNGVTSIGDWAFGNCYRLTGPLTIPDSVTSIGGGAFASCSGLTGTLKIPDSVTSIGDMAFSCCTGLTGPLTIPDSVTSIGKYAFEVCTGLTGLILGKGVTRIVDYAFAGCTGLTGPLTIPDSVTSIGDWAFSYCPGLTGPLTIPDSVTSIGDWAFRKCIGLTGLILGNGLTSIGDSAFDNCSSLTSITSKPVNAPQTGSRVFVEVPSTTVLYTPNTPASNTTYDVEPWTNFARGIVKPPTDPEPPQSEPPIIVIPGVMGSRLFSDVECKYPVWSPFDSLQSFISYAAIGMNMSIDNELFVRPPEDQNKDGVIREYGPKKEYKLLVDRLCTKFPSREIYFFSYDFRQSNVRSANKLRDFINSLGTDKVDLVCHSMGGIVANIYASNDLNLAKINKVITLGTPFEGSPMIYDTMLSNDILDDSFNNNDPFWAVTFNLANLSLRVTGNLAPVVKRNFTGAVELLPSNAFIGANKFYSNNYPMSLAEYGRINSSIFGAQMDQVNSVRLLLEEGKSKLRISNKSYYGVGIYPSKRTVKTVHFRNPPIGTVQIIDMDFENIGDGTVPYSSATQMGNLLNLPLGRVRGFSYDHGGLHKSTESQDWVINILKGVYDLTYTEPTPKGDPYIVARVKCPVDATIKLNDVKLSSDSSDRNIITEFGELYLLGENNDIKIFSLDDIKDYDIELVGTDAGTMDYSIEYFDENNEKVDERIFNDVPITNQTVIKTGSDNSGEIKLNIDTNSDGVVDKVWVSAGTNEEGKEVDLTPPQIDCSIITDYEVLPIGTVVEFSGSDPGNDQPVSITAVLTSGNGKSVVQSGFTPSEGVYELKLTATDTSGNKAERLYHFVIFNPEGQFVTGGGWIKSPGGAYTIDPEMSGEATFGFVSKYKKGASVPTGQTEFRFEAANLDFYASNYQWLVVAGSKLQFKGTGTINDTGNYGFMVTAVDGQKTSAEDRFMIKIWDMGSEETIYDNQIGTDGSAVLSGQSTLLGGGNITIHK